MKKILLSLFIACLLIGAVIVYVILNKHPMATINGHVFYLDIAKTEQEQEIGLAKYSSLPTNKAMYFPFDPPSYQAFWMKNMKFSIDIIFIRNNKIITIFNNVAFPSPKTPDSELQIYRPSQPTDGVIEIHAGLAKKYNTHVGDVVQLSL